jgi:hypothetical protein
MKQLMMLAESANTEKFWIDPDGGTIEHTPKHDLYLNPAEEVAAGWVQGAYSNFDQHYYLIARDERSLCLALRILIKNHDSAKGMHYDIVQNGEVVRTSTLDYAGMMGFRMSGRLPVSEPVSQNA